MPFIYTGKNRLNKSYNIGYNKKGKGARLVDELGSAVIMKNNIPKYLVIEFSKADNQVNASDETAMELSRKIIQRNKEAYEV